MKRYFPTATLPTTASLWLLSLSLSFLIACQNESNESGTANHGTTTDTLPTQVTYSSIEKPLKPLSEGLKNANIYEVNIRQYTPEGTFKAFEAHLPRLQKMGVDILWLMPIYPIGEKNRKGSLGSYYAVKDYRAVNPEHGTMEEFKTLVDKAHSMGMYVILDWVANHTAWDNQLIEEHPDWYTKDANGNFQSPVADWTDVVDLNYDSQALREYMIGSLKFWVQETNIDGYRCDVAEMVPLDFWKSTRTELDAIKPVFMLAEGEDPKLHQNGFDMTYTWELMHLNNQIAKKEKSPKELYTYMEHQKKKFQPNDFRMYFTTNHDENSWNGTVYERYGFKGYKAFATLCFTLPGMPLIYSGQEAGLDHRLPFFDKDQIDWRNMEDEAFYAKLIQLKHESPALWNGEAGGEFIPLETTSPDTIFAFARVKADNVILVVLNLTDGEVHADLNVTDQLAGPFMFLNYKGGIPVKPVHELYLEPWAHKVLYRSEKLFTNYQSF